MYDEFVRKASLLLGNLSSIQVSKKSVVLEREIYTCPGRPGMVIF